MPLKALLRTGFYGAKSFARSRAPSIPAHLPVL